MKRRADELGDVAGAGCGWGRPQWDGEERGRGRVLGPEPVRPLEADHSTWGVRNV